MAVKLARNRLPKSAQAIDSVIARVGRMAVAVCCGLSIFMQPAIVLADENMAVIPTGRFTPLFKETDGPGEIEVAAFLLDRYAVSNGEYQAFIEASPHWAKESIKPIFSDANYLRHHTVESAPAIAHQPVTNIPWFAARAYCKSQGKRLPTTAEWEFVAQASADAPDGSKDPEFRQRILDWYTKPSSDKLPDVRDTPVNFWGVHGMHGVVWELVNDFNTALVTGESRGDTQLDKQLFCGAGAATAVDPSDYAAFMRYALRSSYRAHYSLASLGFRCAKNRPTGQAALVIDKGDEGENG